jgi:hypothetical protein
LPKNQQLHSNIHTSLTEGLSSKLRQIPKASKLTFFWDDPLSSALDHTGSRHPSSDLGSQSFRANNAGMLFGVHGRKMKKMPSL